MTDPTASLFFVTDPREFWERTHKIVACGGKMPKTFINIPTPPYGGAIVTKGGGVAHVFRNDSFNVGAIVADWLLGLPAEHMARA